MEIIAIGGYNEFGRNMTEVKVGDESVIIDMGIKLDRVLIHEDSDLSTMDSDELVKRGIFPDDRFVQGRVKAIIISHGHLDHLGAVTKFTDKYDVPIYATPYTAELIKAEKRYNRGFKGGERVVSVQPGEIIEVSPNIKLEFVAVTHSILHASFVALHTPEGVLIYANDFKFDDTPVLGETTDYDRLMELGQEGVKCLIIESTRVMEEERTPSEDIARKLLFDTLSKADEDSGLIVTTFSSHLQRIRSILDVAELIGRRPVLLGRSMAKYSGIGEKLGLIKMPKTTSVYGSQKAVAGILKNINSEGRENYLIIATGHQGEQDAILSRIANREFDFRIGKDDQVAFSANVIPNPMNRANRYVLETKLRIQGARIIKGLHVSGHAAREDHRYLLRVLNPENIVPCHGDLLMLSSYAELAESMGYELNKDLHLIRNGQKVVI
ncbi:MAG: RNase J family beta-CASP ribonuclease [Methanobacteriota archaeon]|nr:MAG: RNase J family beta-CASP ribonuclease [Euryarchaeota archaeon]